MSSKSAVPRRLKRSMHKTRSMDRQKAARKRAIVRLFKKFDSDGDMYLTKKELKEFMRSLGLETDSTTVSHFLKVFDMSKDEKIGFAEFEAGMERMNKTLEKKQKGLRSIFDKFDTNSSGSINRSELAHLLKSLGEHYDRNTVKTLMAQFDKDKDGEISFDEFERWVLYRESEQQEKKLYFEIFEEFDADNDGQLDASELEALLERLGPRLSKKERHKMAKTLKKKGVGASREAFAEGLVELQKDRESFEEMVSTLFDECDHNGNGVVEKSELAGMLKKAGVPSDALKVGDEPINYHDFRAMILKLQNAK